MADNSLVPVASGNETFANDDIGGVKYPRPKINWGPDGTANDVDVASGKPLPVQVRSATGLIPVGEPTDAASTATDTTSVSIVSILKQVSASVQTFAGIVGASKAAIKSASGDIADGAIATLGTKADAANTATDTTSVSGISILKQVSASIQSLAGTVSSSKVATKAASGDFADGSITTLGAKNDAKSTATDGTSVSIMQVIKQISAALQGILSTAQETSTISNAGTSLTPKFKLINASSSGANTVIALVSSKKIRILSAFVSPNAAVNLNFQSHTTTATATGLHYAANQGNGLVLPFNPVGWFETATGEALDLNLSGAVAVGGQICYIEV